MARITSIFSVALFALLASASPLERDGTPSDADIAKYLKLHNDVRAQHGAQSLVWSTQLIGYTQARANRCVLSNAGGLGGIGGQPKPQF